jgi:hypothetical protein
MAKKDVGSTLTFDIVNSGKVVVAEKWAMFSSSSLSLSLELSLSLSNSLHFPFGFYDTKTYI